jgi:hypothetical protein
MEGAMYRLGLVCAISISCAGCATNSADTTGFADALSGLTGAISTSAAMDQQLAEAYTSETSQLEYLSRNTETCRDNKQTIKSAVRPKSIQVQEEKRLNERLKEVELLREYAKALLAISKDAQDFETHVSIIQSIVSSSNGVASNFPAVREDASAIAIAGKAILEGVKQINRQRTNLAIRSAAIKMQPHVNKMVESLKKRVHLVSDRTQIYLNAWRVCADEKFAFMRDRAIPNVRAAHLVDLTSSYGTFQSQYRGFLNSIPQVDKKALDAIKEANARLIDTDIAELGTTAEQLNSSVGAIITAYNSAKALPRQLDH